MSETPQNNIVRTSRFSDAHDRLPKSGSLESGIAAEPHEAETWTSILFEPSDILEIRCLPPKETAADLSPLKFTWSRTARTCELDPWIRASQLGSLVSRLEGFNAVGVSTFWMNGRQIRSIELVRLNVYCSANPRNRMGGSKSRDVILARSVFADLEHVSFEQAVERIEKAKLPKPTMTVNSGHGVHLYWRLIDPITDLGAWKSFQKRLIQVLGSDTSIHDPPRIMRLPGFVNLNGVPAPCGIIDADEDRRYGLSEIDSVLPPLEHQSVPAAPTSHRFAELGRRMIMRRAIAYQSKVPLVPQGERNSTIFKLAVNLREQFGVTANELFHLTRMWNARLDEPLDPDELFEVTKKAFRFVDATNLPRGRLLTRPPDKAAEEPLVPVVSLDDWREQMQASRLASLHKPPAIYFDGSPTGAGKSTADLAAMRAAGQSLTLLPTHKACEELAEQLMKDGIVAAAFPALDESTCERFGDKHSPGEAQIVQRAGLDVGRVLCPDCPFYKTCEYQKRRDLARNAPHAVATHARAAHSNFAIAGEKPIVFIHEDARDLLRPTMRITANRTTGTPSLHDLEQILEIAREAVQLAEMWGDTAKEATAVRLHKSVKELIAHLTDTTLLNEVRHAEGRTKSLPTHHRLGRLEGVEQMIYRAVRCLGLNPNGEALRLCLAHALGELESLTLAINDTFGKEGRPQFHQSVIGVRRISLPEHTTVWFEDATGDHELLSTLIERPVVNDTPLGRLEFKVPPLQFARAKESDVTLQTSPNTVRGLVRGLLVRHPTAKKVGIITHRVHLPAIRELEPLWMSRLAKLDYFRSGNDRASNKWLDCDLVLILGTPRVPPSAVREALIQVGNAEEAGKDGEWRSHIWQGYAPDGEKVEICGLGYENPSWDRMHQLLVRSSLLQAVGRGRGVIETGVPVVVVSNERLGIPVAAEDLVLLKDPEARTLHFATLKIAAVFPTYNTVGEIAVSTAEIVSALAQSDEVDALKERQVRSHLSTLRQLGLLEMKGARKGWTWGQILLAMAT